MTRWPALLVTMLVASGAATPAGAQQRDRITFEVLVPLQTPKSTTVWISGNVPDLGSWNGAGVLLTHRGDRRYTASMSFPRGTQLEFKVTRGSWDTVEKSATGGEIANRRHTVNGTATVRITVEAWRDQVEDSTPRRSTRTGDIRDFPKFSSDHVSARNVHVYLPPGYDADSTRRYPVMYFHDGQNVFDSATSFMGAEWRADETAERLIGDGTLQPFIGVAVWNTAERTTDYTPVIEPSRRQGGGAERYARFLIEELKPLIDERFRTRTGPEDTGVIGSSLGGVLSLYLGLEHPDVFRMVGCVSPAAWWGDRDLARRVRAARPEDRLRIWLDIGTDEGVSGVSAQKWVDEARDLRNALTQTGYREGEDLHFEVVQGARHDERAWADRLDRILLFLLGAPAAD